MQTFWPPSHVRSQSSSILFPVLDLIIRPTRVACHRIPSTCLLHWWEVLGSSIPCLYGESLGLTAVWAMPTKEYARHPGRRIRQTPCIDIWRAHALLLLLDVPRELARGSSRHLLSTTTSRLCNCSVQDSCSSLSPLFA